MKLKTLTTATTVLVLIGLSILPASAQSKQKIAIEAAVPFEFVVGNRAFPAGTYVFEMATGMPLATDRAGVLVVHSKETKVYAAILTDVTLESHANSGPEVQFVRDGDRVFLSKVYRHGNAIGFQLYSAPRVEQAEDSEPSRVTAVSGTLIDANYVRQ